MKFVLVDIDETMISVPKGINAASSAVMFERVFGVSAHEELIDNVGKTEQGIIKEVLHKVGVEIITIPQKAYKVWGEVTDQMLKTNPVRILPGMLEFLDALKNNKEICLTLLTGNSPWRAEAKLQSAHFDSYFKDPDTKVLSGVFGDMTAKRDELFDLIKQKAQPNDTFVIVDDSLIGAKMAKKHGAHMIMVATGKATGEELRAYTPNVFPDFGEERWKSAVSLIERL